MFPRFECRVEPDRYQRWTGRADENVEGTELFEDTISYSRPLRRVAGIRFGSFAIRGEFEYFDVDDADDVYLISLSALYTF